MGNSAGIKNHSKNPFRYLASTKLSRSTRITVLATRLGYTVFVCNEISTLIPLYANFSVVFCFLFNGTIMMIANHCGEPGALHLTAVCKITHDCYMISTFASKRLKQDCKHDCDCDGNLIQISD